MVRFSDFDKLFNLFLNEIDRRLNEKLVDDQGYGKEPKVVDTPVLEVCKCEENGGCCGNCSCTKDINKNEDYTNSITTKDYENTPLTTTTSWCDTDNQLVDECEDALPQYSEEELKSIRTNPSWKCSTFDNWVNIGDGVWTCSVLAMVCDENININLLDNSRVHIEYDEEFSTPDNNDTYTHHHYVSGSYVFPLPPNVDTSTLKARRNRDFIELSVSEKKEVSEASCIRINIQN